MRRILFGLLMMTLSAAPSLAQFPTKNVIVNSGNGANNVIMARNGMPFPHAQPVGFPFPGQFGQPSLIAQPGFVPQNPGHNVNRVVDSGNGIGNTIIARNGVPFGSPGNFAPGFPFGSGGFGVNVNVITNSGNGVGNVIRTVNNTPGGININVITNSGNGAGNVIRAGNR